MVERIAMVAVILVVAPRIVPAGWTVGFVVVVAAVLIALPWAVPLLLLGAWTGPRLASAWEERRVHAARQSALPGLLFALRLEAEDGAGVTSSLLGLDPDLFPDLSDALRRFQHELEDSFNTRRALEALARSLGIDQGRRLVDALTAGESLGIPLRQTLVNQESLVRTAQLASIRRRAGYVPYVLTILTGLLFVNGAILLGYPRLLELIRTVAPHL